FRVPQRDHGVDGVDRAVLALPYAGLVHRLEKPLVDGHVPFLMSTQRGKEPIPPFFGPLPKLAPLRPDREGYLLGHIEERAPDHHRLVLGTEEGRAELWQDLPRMAPETAACVLDRVFDRVAVNRDRFVLDADLGIAFLAAVIEADLLGRLVDRFAQPV